ncbi:Theobromine synthase protein [Dioscorea alata]|uniref:Theobromine synthase protein n=1 Tax=Dioscorea alata TaxID=55571 RepID=A0ACB7URJ7_DIOAL|nr:Theobromine synthase protein [Dioscorea alata]
MNAGDDDKSYAQNSTIQNVRLSVTRSVRQSAIMEAYKSASFPKTMSIGDLGCSLGPNTLLVASDAIDAVEIVHKELNQPLPEIHIQLNDLPRNDFNGLINSLECFQKSHRCFISVVPGSFYGRLFPSHSLHFIHSSSSLNWLSQVPLDLQNEENAKINRGKICISKTSPPCVLEAYSKQFQRDFSLFLKCRGEEQVPGGCMVLTLLSRSTSGNSDPSSLGIGLQWEILAQALVDMASEGVVDEEKIDSCNAPFYVPSLEEMKHAIVTEGSFSIKSIESFEIIFNGTKVEDTATAALKLSINAQQMANMIRAVTESILVSHFGEEIIDELFVRYSYLLEVYFSKNMFGSTTAVVFLKRNAPYINNLKQI